METVMKYLKLSKKTRTVLHILCNQRLKAIAA